MSSPGLVRVLVCVVPAAECPPRCRLGVGGVSSPVLVRVLVCVAPVAECPPSFRLGVGGVSSPVLVRVLLCVVPAAECPHVSDSVPVACRWRRTFIWRLRGEAAEIVDFS